MTDRASLDIRALGRLLCILVLLAGLLPAMASAKATHTFAASYDQTWSAILADLAKHQSPITSQDKGSGVISGGFFAQNPDSNPWVSQYTTQRVRALSGWTDVQLGYTYIAARRGPKTTEVEIDLTISVFNVWTSIWRSMESSGKLEQQMFDAIQSRLDSGGAGTGATASDEGGTLEIASRPDKADIEIDGRFVGQTPATLPLDGGEHEIKVSKSGYRPWSRTLAIVPGGKSSLEAALEKKK